MQHNACHVMYGNNVLRQLISCACCVFAFTYIVEVDMHSRIENQLVLELFSQSLSVTETQLV